MYKIYNMIAALSLAIFVAGCSKSIPDCSDDEATDLVKQVISKKIAEEAGEENAKNISFKISFIETKATDKKSGAHKCSAHLNLSNKESDEGMEIPITYNVDKEDGEITVMVMGLDALENTSDD